MPDQPDEPELQFVAESLTVSGGSVIVALRETGDTAAQRAVWIDGILRETGSDRRRRARIFLEPTDAISFGIRVIQAAATPPQRGT